MLGLGLIFLGGLLRGLGGGVRDLKGLDGSRGGGSGFGLVGVSERGLVGFAGSAVE